MDSLPGIVNQQIKATDASPEPVGAEVNRRRRDKGRDGQRDARRQRIKKTNNKSNKTKSAFTPPHHLARNYMFKQLLYIQLLSCKVFMEVVCLIMSIACKLSTFYPHQIVYYSTRLVYLT